MVDFCLTGWNVIIEKPPAPCLWNDFFFFLALVLFLPLALQWWHGQGPSLHGLSSDEQQGFTWIEQEIVYRAVLGIQCCCALGHSWVRECWICNGEVDFRFHMLRDVALVNCYSPVLCLQGSEYRSTCKHAHWCTLSHVAAEVLKAMLFHSQWRPAHIFLETNF